MIINIYVSDSNLTYNLQLIVWLDIFNVLVFVIFFNIHIWNNVYLPHRLYPCIYVSFQYMLPCTLGISSTSLSSLCARIPVSLHPCISVSLYPVSLYPCIPVSMYLYPCTYLLSEISWVRKNLPESVYLDRFRLNINNYLYMSKNPVSNF